MKKIAFLLFASLILFSSVKTIKAQSQPVLYFCVDYGDSGEVGISDRFTTGAVTVMVKSSEPLGFSLATIHIEKLDSTCSGYEYYGDYDYKINPEQNYVYFTQTDVNDLSFYYPGIYRVFLLNGENTIASSLVEIIDEDAE